MNQILKRHVYGKGNRATVAFMSELAGMNETEDKILWMLHDGQSDQYIEDAIGISKAAREEYEECIAAKLGIAIFCCINKAMDAKD